jgi:uncharacterized membrane protein YhaH (DUF805 family)
VTGAFAAALEPLRRYADFSGRSGRSELALFYLVAMLANLLARWGDAVVFDLIAGRAPYPWVSIVMGAALFCPTVALGVRRLHDTGRSGWWLLLALPALAINMWDAWRRLGEPFALGTELPALVLIPLMLALLALMVLLLWADEAGTNRYGPNPRCGAPEAAS